MRLIKNWQGIPTSRLTFGYEVMVPRDNSTLVLSAELLNYIIQSQTTKGFRVANFAMLSDERRSLSKIFLLFENLKGLHVRKGTL